MIPIPELKVRGLYVVDGRNFSMAVWDGEAFVGRRYKFSWRLSGELHHDADPHFGTVRPTKYLHQVPDHLSLLPVLPRQPPTTPPSSEVNYALFGYLTIAEDRQRQREEDARDAEAEAKAEAEANGKELP